MTAFYFFFVSTLELPLEVSRAKKKFSCLVLRLYPEEDHEIIMGAKSCATPYIFMYVCDYFRGCCCCHIEEGAFTFVSDTMLFIELTHARFEDNT